MKVKEISHSLIEWMKEKLQGDLNTGPTLLWINLKKLNKYSDDYRATKRTGAGKGNRQQTRVQQNTSNKTIKAMLGELYADKEYLEKLKNDDGDSLLTVFSVV